MKVVAFLLALLTVVVHYNIWVDEQGLPALRRLDSAIDERRAANAQLAARNARLAAEVRDLGSGLGAVEERARRDLGMLKSDEVFFQIDRSLLGSPDAGSPEPAQKP